MDRIRRTLLRAGLYTLTIGLGAGSPSAHAQNIGAPTGVTPPPAARSAPATKPDARPATKTGGASATAPGAQPAPTDKGMTMLRDGDAPAGGPPVPAPPTKTEEGTLGGSDFRIDIPNGSATAWNHRLILYFHGYQSGPQRFALDPLTKEPNPPARLIVQMLLRGYAVAQPGYHMGGWAIAGALPDAEALRVYFGAHYGTPEKTFVLGQSMGGLLTVLTLEQHPDVYVGGLALCGVLAPADLVMQRAFANRVAFDAFFPGILPDVEHIPAGFRMNDPVTSALVQKALDAHPPEAALLRSLADIHTNRGLADVLVFNTFAIQDLREKSGGNPFDNRNLIYTGTTDDNALNAKVKRYEADPQAIAYVARYGSPTGQLQRPLIALHTIYDPLVPASTAGYYDELTRRLGLGRFFVQQYVDRDGHCNVTPEQVGLGFDELQAWVDNNLRPEPGRLPDAFQKPVHQQPNAKPVLPKNVGKPL